MKIDDLQLTTRKESKNYAPKYLIIPAAGLGTRMKSVNPDIPKEMLPVGDKPAIQYAVEEGLSADIKNIIIIPVFCHPCRNGYNCRFWPHRARSLGPLS